MKDPNMMTAFDACYHFVAHNKTWACCFDFDVLYQEPLGM